ncbi:MAG: DedA family protein [Deltaproteobacteria bacterium]|nr:DedA family protein [Deltaproteobacteria bacterium]
MEFLIEYGYIGLFVASFLAATILPFSSEFLLGILLLNNCDPYYTITVATFGNVLGSVANYGLGCWGGYLLLRKCLRYSQKDILVAKQRFGKYGTFSLIFAWVPIIGDPLTVAAGLLKINFILFLTLVTVGKLGRYIVLGLSILSFGN